MFFLTRLAAQFEAWQCLTVFWSFSCIGISVQTFRVDSRMNSTDFDDPLYFLLAPPAG